MALYAGYDCRSRQRPSHGIKLCERRRWLEQGAMTSGTILMRQRSIHFEFRNNNNEMDNNLMMMFFFLSDSICLHCEIPCAQDMPLPLCIHPLHVTVPLTNLFVHTFVVKSFSVVITGAHMETAAANDMQSNMLECVFK